MLFQTPSTIFDPIRTLTANIALEMAYALDFHRSALFFCGFLLFMVAVLLVALARVVETGLSIKPRGLSS